MKRVSIISALLILLVSQDCLGTPSFSDTINFYSSQFVGLREKTGHNDGEWIDRFFRVFGMDNAAQKRRTGSGYSWCAAFVVYNYEKVAALLKQNIHIPKSPRVHTIWTICRANELRYKVLDPEDLITGIAKAEPGDVGIMRYGPRNTDWNGHTWLTRYQNSRAYIATREGNTNNALSREGDGCYDKVRQISKLEAVVHVRR